MRLCICTTHRHTHKIFYRWDSIEFNWSKQFLSTPMDYMEINPCNRSDLNIVPKALSILRTILHASRCQYECFLKRISILISVTGKSIDVEYFILWAEKLGSINEHMVNQIKCEITKEKRRRYITDEQKWQWNKHMKFGDAPKYL